MNPIIKEAYYKEFYQAFKDKYYIISNKQSYGNIELVSFHSMEKDQPIPGYNSYYVSNESQFLKAITERLPIVDTAEQKQFFIDYYKNHPELSKDLLKFYNHLWGLRLNKDYKTLFPDIIADKKELFSSILNLSSKDFPLHLHQEFSDLNQFLKDYHATDKEIDLFWEKYFFNKPKLIKDLKYIPQVKAFLLERYSDNKEKLQKYLPIIPSLKSDIQEVSMEERQSVFIKQKPILIYSHINTSKVIETFGITCSYLDSMNTQLSNFAHGFAKYYGIKDIEVIVSKEKNMKFIMSHKNEKVTQQFFEETLLSFFDFLKNNKNTHVTEDNIKSWLLNYNLQVDLEAKGTARKNKL